MAEPTPHERELAHALDEKTLQIELLGLDGLAHGEALRAQIAQALADHAATILARVGELEAQLEHEHRRAEALAELHRLAEEACSRANSAGMRAEAKLVEHVARVTNLRALPKFGSLHAQFEHNRDEWLALVDTDAETYPGEAQQWVGAFGALLELIGPPDAADHTDAGQHASNKGG
jgi:hypothetical protein